MQLKMRHGNLITNASDGEGLWFIFVDGDGKHKSICLIGGDGDKVGRKQAGPISTSPIHTSEHTKVLCNIIDLYTKVK